jgi:prenylcysteine oxidase/farnesylcysteine lyase
MDCEVPEGSTTVHPYNNTAYEPVELGASIFVGVNKNLWRATNEFNLSFYGFEDEDGDMAIWDGEQILLTVCFTWYYYLAVLTCSFQGDGIGVLGLLAKQPQVSVEVRLSLTNENERAVGHLDLPSCGCPYISHSVRGMIDKFVGLYEPDALRWSSIEKLNSALNWTELGSQTGAEYFQSHGVSEMFTNEIIEAATRVNYAQVRRTSCSPVPSIN